MAYEKIKAMKFSQDEIKDILTWFDTDFTKDILNRDFDLNVEFKEKDYVKKFGCRWNSYKKVWYMPADISLENFRILIDKPIYFSLPDDIKPYKSHTNKRHINTAINSLCAINGVGRAMHFQKEQLLRVYEKAMKKDIIPILDEYCIPDINNLILSFL